MKTVAVLSFLFICLVAVYAGVPLSPAKEALKESAASYYGPAYGGYAPYAYSAYPYAAHAYSGYAGYPYPAYPYSAGYYY